MMAKAMMIHFHTPQFTLPKPNDLSLPDAGHVAAVLADAADAVDGV
jgi:hypothetical protein